MRKKEVAPSFVRSGFFHTAWMLDSFPLGREVERGAGLGVGLTRNIITFVRKRSKAGKANKEDLLPHGLAQTPRALCSQPSRGLGLGTRNPSRSRQLPVEETAAPVLLSATSQGLKAYFSEVDSYELEIDDTPLAHANKWTPQKKLLDPTDGGFGNLPGSEPTTAFPGTEVVPASGVGATLPTRHLQRDGSKCAVGCVVKHRKGHQSASVASSTLSPWSGGGPPSRQEKERWKEVIATVGVAGRMRPRNATAKLQEPMDPAISVHGSGSSGHEPDAKAGEIGADPMSIFDRIMQSARQVRHGSYHVLNCAPLESSYHLTRSDPII